MFEVSLIFLFLDQFVVCCHNQAVASCYLNCDLSHITNYILFDYSNRLYPTVLFQFESDIRYSLLKPLIPRLLMRPLEK